MRHLFFVLVTALTLIPADPSCAEAPIGTREYVQLLERASATVRQAGKAERNRFGSGLPVLEKLRKGLPSSVRVRNPSGMVRADLRRLRADLQRVPTLGVTERQRAVVELQAHLAMLADIASDQPLANSEAALHTARSALQQTLARREYKQTMQEQLWERVQIWAEKLLTRLFSKIPERTYKFISWGLAIATGILLLTALFLVGRYLYLRMSRRPERTPTRRRRPPKRIRSSPEQLFETAEAQAKAGRYREALRNVYTAALLLLDRARLLAYSESRTNREYLETLSRLSSPEPANIVEPMTNLFDEKIYGCRQVSAQDYTFEREQYERLEGVI